MDRQTEDSIREEQFTAPDVFRYFREGKSGIQQRLADQIREGLGTYGLNLEDDRRELEKETGLHAGDD